jgi:hypothetical protein
MKRITLFLMTEKWLHFLQRVLEYRSLIGLVVVGTDKALQEDHESAILDLTGVSRPSTRWPSPGAG